MKTKFIVNINKKVEDFDKFINSICNEENVSIAGFVSFYINLPIDKRKVLSDKLYKESFLNNVEIEKLSRNEIMKIFIIEMFFKNFKKRELSNIIEDKDSFYLKYLFINLDYIIFYLLCEKKINFFQDLEKFIDFFDLENLLQITKKITKEMYNNVALENIFSKLKKTKIRKDIFKEDSIENAFDFILFSFIDDLCKRKNLKLSPLSLEKLITEIIIILSSKNISEALKTSVEDFGK